MDRLDLLVLAVLGLLIGRAGTLGYLCNLVLKIHFTHDMDSPVGSINGLDIELSGGFTRS